MLAMLKNVLKEELETTDEESVVWTRPVLECPLSTPVVDVQLPFFGLKKRKVMLCCGGNYLGLADVVNGYDTSVGGSPLISGHSNSHMELEETISRIYGGRALVYSNVTLAVQGLLQAVTRPLHKVSKGKLINVILYDSLNHSCLMEALRVADVDYRRAYRHGDMEHLEKLLRRFSAKGFSIMILTDGVFSMEGDFAPLDRIVDLALTYNAAVIVDDAHATGVLGRSGKGTCEHFGLEGEREPIQIVSFSKAVGAVGSAIISDEEFTRFLVRNSRNYIFCGALSPQNCIMTTHKIHRAFSEAEHREKLLRNSAYMRETLSDAGFNVRGNMSIIPVYIGDNKKALAMCRDLFMEYDIYCRAIIYPVVPEALLRFTLTASHSREQVQKIIDSMLTLGGKYNVIDTRKDNRAVA